MSAGRSLDHARWRRIDQLFQLAVERSPGARSRLLERECAGDPELRRRVESLLELDAGAVPLLDGVASEGEPPDDPSPVPGERIGPYRLGERLGEGGMSVVFAAERVDGHLGHRVALKLLKDSHLTRLALARFRNEGRILARLEHPNVARVYDAGTTTAGVPYLVLERVDGRPIDEHCREAGLGVDARVALFLGVLEAVAFAHRNLIVHRDLKPSNVLVDGGGVPKLLDFGIAKLLGPAPALGALTGTSFQPMTPRYASPEQLVGMPVTTASDVYALGLLLYELLTGSPPYRLEWSSPAEIARLASGELTIARPSSWAPRGRIRSDLDRVVLAALAARPEDRYRSVEALADDLRCYLGGYPVLVQGATRLYRARRFVARHRLSVSLTAAATLILLALTASLAATVGALSTERDRVRAEAATAEQVGSFLAGLFEAAEPAASRGAEVTARDLLDLGAGELAESGDQRPEVHAALAAAIGKAYLELSHLDEARPLLEESLRLRREALAAGDPRLADALELLSELELRASGFRRAEALAAEAVARRRRAGGASGELAGSLIQLAAARLQRGDVDRAEPPLTEALALADGAGGQGALLRGRIHYHLGGIAGRRGEWARAEELTREAVARLTEALGPDHPRVLAARRDLATFSSQAPGGNRRAVELLRDLLADQRRVFAPDHEQVLMTLVTLGAQLADLADHEGSRAAYEEALPALERRFGPDHLITGAALVGLGHALDRTGDLDGAESALRRGLEAYRASLAPDAADQAHPLRLLAEVLRRKGEPEAAEELAREAVAILERESPADTWYLPLSRGVLARSLIDQRRFAEAEPLLVGACETLGATLGAADASVRAVREELAQLYRAWDRPAPAPGVLACWPGSAGAGR